MASPSLDEVFEAAVAMVHALPKDGDVKTSNDEKLRFYGLYKQATLGPCNVGKPGFWNVVDGYKWESWKKLGDMSSEQAKANYIDELKRKIAFVQTNYPFQNWMGGENDGLIESKLALLGFTRDGRLPEASNKLETISDEQQNQKTQDPSSDEHKDVFGNGHEDVSTSMVVMSDAEYADAVDDEELSVSRSSSFLAEGNPHRRHTSSSTSMRASCLRLERELKAISEQIERLGKIVEDRHNLLFSLFKKATVYLFVPRQFSYKLTVFFLLWPFVAHFLLRFFRTYFR